jgi:hypothetical protein
MWSHYADWHRGAALEFQPIIGSEILGMSPVSYSKEVPVATNLDNFAKFLTGVGPKPVPVQPHINALFTKSSVWDYGDEYRVINKGQNPGDFSLRKFDPTELVGIYLGCKVSKSSHDRIIALVSTWSPKLSLFQMRDERIRYELTAERISI